MKSNPRVGGDFRMARREPVEELPRAPIGMPAPRHAQQVGHVRRDPMRTGMGGVAPVLQAPPSVLVEAVEPLVARFPADAVPGAELGACVEAAAFVGAELLAQLAPGIAAELLHESVEH